jgi:hypothetical protein
VGGGADLLDGLERAVRPRRMGSPGRTSPPATTTVITPALRISVPSSSRPSVAAISPGWIPSSCVQGLRRPVTSTTASSPRRSRVPVGSPSRSTPRVVTFSPSVPGSTEKPAARSSSCSSSCITCTWRRFGLFGVSARRDLCWTVAPQCASASTPSPVSSRIDGSFRFDTVCSALRLTAVTIPLMSEILPPAAASVTMARCWSASKPSSANAG